MSEKADKTDLTGGSIAIKLIMFVGPLFISNILQTLYNVVDMAVVGQYVGDTGLSAVSVCGDLINIATFAAFGFSGAGQILVARHTGAKDYAARQQTIGNMLTFLLVLSLALTAGMIVFREYLLDFVNTPAEARDYARQYLLTCAAGMVFTFGYNGVSAVFRGMGDSMHAFIFLAIASVLNILLDFVFVGALGMKIFGAALATVLSQAVSLVASLVYMYSCRERFGFDFTAKRFRLHKDALLPLILLGVPMALQYGLVTLGKLWVSRWVNRYGITISAITGVGNKLNSIGMIFSGAIGTSASAMISQCIGAKKYERVGGTVFTAGCIAVGVAALLSAIVAVFPRAVFGIFSNDEALLEMTGEYKYVVVVMFLSSAFRAPMNGLINGSGKSALNLLLAVLDGLVGHIGLAALLGFGLNMGVTGLWYGSAVAGYIPFFVGLVCYFTGSWKNSGKREKQW